LRRQGGETLDDAALMEGMGSRSQRACGDSRLAAVPFPEVGLHCALRVCAARCLTLVRPGQTSGPWLWAAARKQPT